MTFTVVRASDQKRFEFHEQSVASVLLEDWKGFPQIEIWGRGGGAYWTRGLCRMIRGTYVAVRYGKFEEWPRPGNEKAATIEPPFDMHWKGDDPGEKLHQVKTRRPN